MAIIDTIRALLAKAESTTFPEEAAAYLAKAQELQTKFAIDSGMLDRAKPQQEREGIVQARFCEERNTPLIKAKRNLVCWLADINNCYVVMGARRAYLEVTGHESDVAMVGYMYTSIMLQLQTAMGRAENSGEVIGPVAGWRVSYAHAYVRRVGIRLMEAKAAQRARSMGEANATPGTDLVLVNRAQVAKKAAEDANGPLRKGKKIPTSDNNVYGASAGRRDGQRADLGGDRIGSSSRKELS